MKKIIGIGLVGLFSLSLVACGGNKEDESKADNNTSASSSFEKAENKSTNKEKSSFKDMTLTTDDFNIKITGTEVVDGYDDSKVLVVKFDFTNKSDELLSPYSEFLSSFDVFQDLGDTIQDLQMGIITDHTLYQAESENGNAQVKKDSTVQSVSSYEIKDINKPVDFKVTEGYSSKVLGTFSVDVQ